ncbi:hypothetical protein CL6EHI_031950 [Entamoeba histolytica]|uniref:Tail specific protease domain-containing protein n=1 Tax=Entamoeba histolytica TaxID=5759 RepID=A0A175JZV3_ENTHI|nr:hypothetical protein CL6EHI_031950 [Entamoeba histolytica]
MNILILLFIGFSLSKQCNDYKQGYDGLKYYLESYVFKDILKNPPQPAFSDDYYNKIDIDAELNKINTQTTNMYDFYSQIKNFIVSIRDSHLSFGMDYTVYKPNLILKVLGSFLPFSIYQRSTTGGISVDVPQEVINNENVAVKTINGEDPFDIIRKFGKKYIGFNSPHAQFEKACSTFVFAILEEIPLTKEYLNTPITIIWENGESVSVTYSILKLPLSSITMKRPLQMKQLKQRFEPRITLEEIKSENEMIKRMKREEGINQYYASKDDSVYCSSSSNINKLEIFSFNPESSYIKSYEETISKCIDLFDSNDYPIQVVFSTNEEENVIYSQWIEKILSAYDDVDMIVSGRISNFTESVMKREYGNILDDPHICRVRESYVSPEVLGEWYTNPNIIKYDDVEHKVSQPSVMKWEPMKLMRKPRKPTEIVVYTDPLCYSGCSTITKGLKEWGSAIIVGYGGDIYGEDKEFEVGLTSSNAINVNDIDEDNILKQYGYSLKISLLERYKHNYNYNENIPIEFLTDVVDERIRVSSSTYYRERITEETKKIVEKYKTKCNQKNKRLVKRDSRCDKEINIQHGHGGYECGDNGEWSTKCVLAYCDSGYKFDYINNKCIEDVCVYPPNPSNGAQRMTINIFLIIIGIITLIL